MIVGSVDASPINAFSQCHAGILSSLRLLADLPELAAQSLSTFDRSVLHHHADEEAELFPAVLKSAAPGGEALHMQAMIDQLVPAPAARAASDRLYLYLRQPLSRRFAG